MKLQERKYLMKKLLYVHQNLMQAESVTKEEDWKYSSARDFCGMKGLVELCYS